MSALRQLRLVAFLEGLSFIVLLFIAVPLKHLAAMPLPVRVVGSLHGVLFIAFLVTLACFAPSRSHKTPHGDHTKRGIAITHYGASRSPPFGG